MNLNGIAREESDPGYRDELAGRDLRRMFTAAD
jgi:hypothetical protein